MRMLSGYQKPIVALAASPDGAWLYSAALDQSMVWAWDLSTGEVVRKLRGVHRGGVGTLACSPDGRWLLSAEEYNGVGLWALPEGEGRELRTEGQDATSPRPAVAIDPTSRLGAFPFSTWGRQEDRFGVQVWDLAGARRGKLITAGYTKAISAVAFAPAGGLLAAGSSDKTVKLWDHEAGEERLCLRQKAVPSRLAFRPDGKALAVAGAKNVLVWDLSSGKLAATLTGQGGMVTGLGYSPDGRHLASTGLDGVLALYDARTNELLGRRHLEVGELGALAWLPDSRAVAAGGVKLIVLCEVGEVAGAAQTTARARGEPLSLAGHESKVRGLAYSPDGKALCSWARDLTRVWDLSAGAGQAKEKAAFQATRDGGCPDRLSFSPDGTRVSMSFRSGARLSDAGTGKLVRDFRKPGHSANYLSFTPSGRLFLAFGGDRMGDFGYRLELRDSDGGKVLAEKRGETENTYPRVTHAALVCPGDERIYFALLGNGVFRWTPSTGEVVHLFRPDTHIAGLCVSADERVAVTLGGNTARVWGLPDVKKKFDLKHPLTASGVAALPDGRLLTSCYDGVVRLWDLSGGSELMALDLGMGKLYSFAVSPDHMTFAAGVEKDSRVVLMDVPE